MTSPLDVGMDSGLSKAADARTKARMDNLRNQLMGGTDKKDPKRLKQACQDFEAVFMNNMWQKMRATVPKAGYLHSRYEDQYVSMFDHEMSKKFASAGGIGLADMMFSQLSEKLAQKSQTTAPGGPPRPLERGDYLSGQPSVPQESIVAPEPKVGQQAYSNPAQLVGAELAYRVDSLAARIEMRMGQGESTALAANEENYSSLQTVGQNHDQTPGRVITPFGWSSDPDSGQRRYSSAVEVAVAPGGQVTAVRSGEVAYAGNNVTGDDANGRMVIINHDNGVQSRYQFSGDLKVVAGQQIQVGKPIAVVGQNNPDTPAALRFEMRRNGQAENPESLVNRALAKAGTVSGQHTG